MAAASFLAVTNPSQRGADVYRMSIVDLIPSTAYPANGEPCPASQFGLTVIHAASATVRDGSAIATYDQTNQTIRLWSAVSTELSGDQSGKIVRVVAFGR
jgi:hypothetical protein